jgi:hypothetical protein
MSTLALGIYLVDFPCIKVHVHLELRKHRDSLTTTVTAYSRLVCSLAALLLFPGFTMVKVQSPAFGTFTHTPY